MTEPILKCPNCNTEIKLTESLAAPMMEAAKKEFANQLAQKDKERERAIADERLKTLSEATKRAKDLVADELQKAKNDMAELNDLLEHKNDKLAEAQKKEADFMRKQRELDDEKREMALVIEQRVNDALNSIRDKAKEDAEATIGMKLAEREQVIASMQHRIEDLKKRSEQGSQQLQGETLELQIEDLLRDKFLTDIIEPVPKGVHGGDIVHTVVDRVGKKAGTILWETKRTKSWRDDWLVKLRADQRDANAELAVIISTVLPKDVKTFDLIDGVWVAEPKYALPLTLVLRRMLIELDSSKSVKEGQETKMEIMYTYLTGTRFRQRVQAIVEHLSNMRDDLDKERKSLTRAWAKREEQTTEIALTMAGMYGDLQGIAGKSLQEVEGLTLIGG